MRNTLRQLLSVCVVAVVGTIIFAGIAVEISVPSNPGRPLATELQSDGGTVNFLTPRKDGGSPITDYLVECREKWDLRWRCIGISKELNYPFKMRKGVRVQFRVSAVNAVGRGDVSGEGDFVTIRGSFDE